ncbi:hypothetical protein Tco_0316694 [Tanacetum coccineum]
MPPRRSTRVNNEADPAFTAAVAQAVADLLPTLTARITDEIRQNENNGNNGPRRNARRVNTGGSGNDGDAQPTDIHVWLERLATYKLEGDAHSWWRAYKLAKGGDAYVATLSWNDFCDIFFLQYFPYSEKERLAGFLGAKAGTQEEQAKHFKWGLNDFVLDRILNTEFTDVAQVDNAARNIEIFHDRLKMKETARGTETAIVYDHQKHHHRGLIRELMIEGIVTDMPTVADMVTRTDMALTYGVVIDRAVTDIVMVVTDREMVVRRRGVTKINMFGANIIVVLMGHQARGDTRIITHLPHSALSLDKLAMPPHLHKKFHMGVAIATGCRGYYKPGTRAWVRRVTAKDGTITKFLRKFPEYKPTKEEEENFKLKATYENVIYDISDGDSNLESTARSRPRDSEMEGTGSSGMQINA